MTAPLPSLTDTWNNAGTVFTAIQMNITNSASAAGSLLFDFQIGGTSFGRLTKAGLLQLLGTGGTTGINFGTSVGASNIVIYGNNNDSFIVNSGAQNVARMDHYFGLTLPNNCGFGFSSTTDAGDTADTILVRDAANIFAQRNSTNAQTLRVYNTFTDASNYERGVFDWTTSANVLTIGPQAAGTGTLRSVSLVGTQILFPNSNSSSAPPISFAGNTNTGIYSDTGNNGISMTFGGTIMHQFLNTGYLNRPGLIVLTINSDLGISRSAAGVIAFGNGSAGDGSATILAKTKAGAFVAGDIPAGSWICGRDTTNNTTKMYYNNAGTLLSVALV